MENVDFLEKMMVYNTRKLDSGKIWILFLFLGWSYGSMNQMGKQIFFYLTFGGLGFWAIYRLFTLSGKIKSFNKHIALECGMDGTELLKLGLV